MRDLRKFRTHVEILKHSHPELVVQLAPEPPENPVELSGSGDTLALKWRGKSLHSERDPARESRHLLEKLSFENGRAYLVFGIGLGYLAAAALEKLPPRSALILLEPDIRILREALGSADLRTLLFDARVRWVSGKDWMEHLRIALRHCEESGALPSSAMLSLPAYRSYFSRQLAEARGLLAQFLNEREIDTETRKELWQLWNRNLTENIPDLLSSAPLKLLTSTFDKIPVVLAGAGPTLDDHLPHLSRLKERALIVAVDTALAPLLAAGCEPDIVLAMDGQEANAKDFEGLPRHSTILLFDAFCYPSIPKQYVSQCRVASQTGHVFSDIDDLVVVKNGLLPLLEHLLDFEFGFLQNGGSVITAGFDLARLARVSAIGLVGVDLSYPNFQTHSKLTNKFHAATSRMSRFVTPEGCFFEETAEKGRMTIPTAAGTLVVSDRVMLMYKHWMEDAAVRTGLPCFTLSSRPSVFLKGFRPLNAEEFISRFGVPRSEIESRLNRCRAVRRPELNSEEILKRVEEFRRDLAALETNPSADHVGPFDLDHFVAMASFEVAERLGLILSVEPESEHLVRRQQAARVSCQWVAPFLDRVESTVRSVWRSSR